MKKLLISSVVALSVAAMPLYAVDEHHPEKAQQAASVPKPAATEKSAGSEPAADPQIGQMQETGRKLQELMGKIRQTSDPVERRKLLQEHMRTMQEGMKQMRGMGGGMMMGMGSGGKQGGMMMCDMMKAHGMMEMRMEMMETMMEHMMQREEMRDVMPKK